MIDNENASIPMDGSAVHYEGGENAIIPAGTYFFRILRLKREQVDATQTMPRHVNLRWLMLLENADGEAGRAWDNLRMYRKWLWKYEQVAKAVGHTPKDSQEIRIDWNAFEGATGRVEVAVGKWKRKDGTEADQNTFKYLVPDGTAAPATPAQAQPSDEAAVQQALDEVPF